MFEFKNINYNRAMEILEQGYIINSSDVEVKRVNDHFVIRNNGFVVAFYYDDTFTLVVR